MSQLEKFRKSDLASPSRKSLIIDLKSFMELLKEHLHFEKGLIVTRKHLVDPPYSSVMIKAVITLPRLGFKFWIPRKVRKQVRDAIHEFFSSMVAQTYHLSTRMEIPNTEEEALCRVVKVETLRIGHPQYDQSYSTSRVEVTLMVVDSKIRNLPY